MPIVTARRRLIVATAAVVLVFSAACGSDETDSGASATAAVTGPLADQTGSATTTSSTTTTSSSTTTTLPPTAEPSTTTPPTTDAPDRITRAEAETLVAAAASAAATLDASVLVAALGETGAFTRVDGTVLTGEELVRFLEDTWRLGNEFRNFSELEETPEGYLSVGERVRFSGQIEPIGLEYRRNAAGDYLMFEIDPVLILGDRNTAADSGLTVDEAEAILTQVVGTYADRDWSRAVEALAPDGAWVEPTFEVSAEQLPEFFESYADIDWIEITGPGRPSSGGFVFPMADHLLDGTLSEYFMIVTTNVAGALRLIYQPALPVDALTPPTTVAGQ